MWLNVSDNTIAERKLLPLQQRSRKTAQQLKLREKERLQRRLAVRSSSGSFRG